LIILQISPRFNPEELAQADACASQGFKRGRLKQGNSSAAKRSNILSGVLLVGDNNIKIQETHAHRT